ncbi:hypothetical protein V8E54_003773 [Elaphomyces granulatus]
MGNNEALEENSIEHSMWAYYYDRSYHRNQRSNPKGFRLLVKFKLLTHRPLGLDSRSGRYLCHSPSTPSADPISFEANLKEDLIDGEVLLNDVGRMLLNDMDKEILGLSTLGQGSWVLAAIRYLRSNTYQTTVEDDKLL